jgi:hypothetical protein
MQRQNFEKAKGTEIPVFLKPDLTRWHIDRITKNLEAWGFFVRFRLSLGKCGGKYAYSVTSNREQLIERIRRSKAEGGKYSISENRARDALESASIQQDRKPPANERQATDKSPATHIERPAIERPAIERPDIKINQTKIRIGHTTNIVGGVAHFLLACETDLIETYNRFCDRNKPKGFLKVDQVTEAVQAALDAIDGMEPSELLEILESEAQQPGGARTFVRCVWNNHP